MEGRLRLQPVSRSTMSARGRLSPSPWKSDLTMDKTWAKRRMTNSFPCMHVTTWLLMPSAYSQGKVQGRYGLGSALYFAARFSSYSSQKRSTLMGASPVVRWLHDLACMEDALSVIIKPKFHSKGHFLLQGLAMVETPVLLWKTVTSNHLRCPYQIWYLFG